MPELPEIETIKTGLASHIIDKIIINYEKKCKVLRQILSNNFDILLNARILSIMRRAKYLLINLDNSFTIVIHLGMSGSFTIQPANYSSQKHDHVIFYLDNQQQLVFNDPRRFGMIYLLPQEKLLDQQIFKALGPEPLTEQFNAGYLASKLAKRHKIIKNVIMDNNIVVGVGNIYASESLFRAKIHPLRPAYSLSHTEIIDLVLAIKNVLISSIAAGGTTLKDFINANSKPGYFQQELLIYNRAGKPCFICSNIIRKIILAGRGSYYCGYCQVI